MSIKNEKSEMMSSDKGVVKQNGGNCALSPVDLDWNSNRGTGSSNSNSTAHEFEGPNDLDGTTSMDNNCSHGSHPHELEQFVNAVPFEDAQRQASHESSSAAAESRIEALNLGFQASQKHGKSPAVGNDSRAAQPPATRKVALKGSGKIKKTKKTQPAKTPQGKAKPERHQVDRGVGQTRTTDGFGRKCFVCGSEGHVKAQCPTLRRRNSQRKEDFVHSNLVDEIQKMKGEVDALREIARESKEKCDSPTPAGDTGGTGNEPGVGCDEPEQGPDNQTHKLNGMRWEYETPTTDFKLISSKVAEVGRTATDIAFFFSYSVWLWVQITFSYFVFEQVARFIGEICFYAMDFYGVPEAAYVPLIDRIEALVGHTEVEIQRKWASYNYLFEKLATILTGDLFGFALVFRTLKWFTYAVTIWGVFNYLDQFFPLFATVNLVVCWSPWLAAPFLCWFFYNYRGFFKTKHCYSLKYTKEADFEDQRPESVSLCDVEVPRVVGLAKHVVEIWFDLGFLGSWKFCEVLKERLKPNMELVVQMSSNVNMFFPDDITALNFFQKQPSRLQNLNSNRVSDLKHDQTAQSSLLAFAVYKDFQRRTRAAGVPL